MRNGYSSIFRRAMVMFAALVTLGSVCRAQTTVTIGSGTATSSGTNGLPIYRSSATSAFHYSKSASLYTTTDLASIPSGSTITAVAFNKSTTATLRNPNTATFSILMKNTSNTALNGSLSWGTYVTGATTVYSNTSVDSTLLAPSGWITFPLSTSFVYSGGALEVYTDWAINTPTTPFTTAAFPFLVTTTTGIQSAGTSSSATLSSSTVLSTTQTRLNNVQFTYTPPVPCTGTPLQGTATASTSTPCLGNTVSIALTGGTIGGGITYQLESSTTSATTGFALVGSSSTASSFTATPALGNTWYRIRTTCANSSLFAQSVAVQVTGQPALATFPYVEPFNAPINGLPSCWTKTLLAGTNDWRVQSSSVDISGPHSGAAYVVQPYGTGTSLLISPAFNLSSFGTNQARINMWVYRHEFAVATDSMQFMVNTAASTTGATQLLLIKPLITEAPTVASSGWYNYTANIPTSFNTTTPAYIVVRGAGAGGSVSYDLGIDSFRLEQVPSCNPPTLVTTSATGTTSGTITFTAASPVPSGGYFYEVRTSGAAGSGATGLAASGTSATSPITVTGLTAGTSYTVYVRSNCGASNSVFSTGVNLTTACNAVTAFPYVEPFNAPIGGLPACWSSQIVSGAASFNWVVGSSSVDISGPHQGAGFVYRPYGTAVTNLFSPPFNLSSFGTNQARISMWVYRHASAPATDSLQFLINTSASTTGAMELLLIRPAIGQVPVVSAGGWYNYTANIPTSFNTTTPAYIIFRGAEISGGSSYDLGVDSFRLEQAPNCNPPTTLAVTATGATTATITYTAAVPVPGNGYTYEVRTSGTPGSGATGLVQSGTSMTSPISITGLTANTAYTIYVRADCGSSFSTYTSGTSFTTQCNPAALPFIENFGTYIPACFSERRGGLTATPTALSGATSDWVAEGYLNVGTTGAAAINIYDNSLQQREWLVSGPIQLAATPSDYVLEFNFGTLNWNTTTPGTLGSDDTVAVVVSTDNGATWSSANALRVWTAANTPVNTTNGGQRVYLPMFGYSGTVRIGFYGSNGNTADVADIDVFIDSMRISTCARPAVALGNDTTVCGNVATLNLNAGNPGATYAYTSSIGTISGTTQTVNLAALINNINATGGAATQAVQVVANVSVGNSACASRDTINITVTRSARVDSFSMTGTDPTFSFSPVNDSFATSYAWTFGDGGTANTASPTHTYNTNGSYTVCLVVSNQCASDTSCRMQMVTADVADVIAGSSIQLFPNPTSADAVITVDGGAKLRGYQVFSAAGALVADRALDETTRTTLETGALAPGIYTLRIQLDKGVVVRKLEVIK